MFGQSRRGVCARWTRALAICGMVVATAVALGTAERAVAQEMSELEVRRGVVRLARSALGAKVAKRVVLRGDLSTLGLASEVDLRSDDVRVLLNGSLVFELAGNADRSGVQEGRFGRWKFREQDVPRRRASRLVLDLSLGKFKLDARGLALDTSVLGDPENAEIVIELGGRRLEAEIDFVASRRQWRFRAKRRAVVTPPGGGNPGGGDPGGGDPGTTPADGAVPFTIVDSGTMSGITTRREVVIRDSGAWSALWAEHRGGTAPSIDFSREIVVGVFQGNQPSAGYGESLVGVVATGGDYDVRHVFSSTQGSCAVATVITQPFVLARVRATTGRVDFTETRAVSICHGGP